MSTSPEVLLFSAPSPPPHGRIQAHHHTWVLTWAHRVPNQDSWSHSSASFTHERVTSPTYMSLALALFKTIGTVFTKSYPRLTSGLRMRPTVESKVCHHTVTTRLAETFPPFQAVKNIRFGRDGQAFVFEPVPMPRSQSRGSPGFNTARPLSQPASFSASFTSRSPVPRRS